MDGVIISGMVALVGFMAFSYWKDKPERERLEAVKEAQLKEFCAYEIMQATRKNETPEDTLIALRSSPHARKSCADYAIKGVPLIPK